MTTIIIKYKILDKQFEYSLDDKTFDKHLLAICDSAKCVGLSTNYVIAADGTNTIVQPMVSEIYLYQNQYHFINVLT